MKKLATIGLTLSLMILVTSGAFAQGRGGGGGGMRGGAGGGNQYGKGNQAAAMQRQMMQNRYRMMQSGSEHQNGTGQQQRFRDGSCGGQVGNQGAGAMQKQMMQNRARQGQSNFGNPPRNMPNGE